MAADIEALLTHIADIAGEKFVDKIWGREVYLLDQEQHEHYCAKLLFINGGFQCSLHYHPKKEETFVVLHGSVYLETYVHPQKHVNDGLGHNRTTLLVPGNKMHMRPGDAHRFWAGSEEGAIVLEVSTRHDEADVVRMENSRAFSER